MGLVEGWGGDGVGNGNGKLIANPFTHVRARRTSTGSNYIYVLFQLTFAVITAALISRRDRRPREALLLDRLPAALGHAVLLPDRPQRLGRRLVLLATSANLDYAGGTVVHINAGVAGGVLALIIGRRVGFMRDPMKPHNLTLTMIGAGLLWFGWYGFNVGSIVFTAARATPAEGLAQFCSETGVTFMNTTLATMAAMLAWLLMERILHGKATSLGAASGIVAGLVAITPSCGAVSIARRAGRSAPSPACVCAYAVGPEVQVRSRRLARRRRRPPGRRRRRHRADRLRRLAPRRRASTALRRHRTGCSTAATSTLLWHQVLGVLFTIVWTGVLTTLIALAIKYTIGWRIDEDDEVDGIDFAEHGESAYDLARPLRRCTRWQPVPSRPHTPSTESTEGAMA